MNDLLQDLDYNLKEHRIQSWRGRWDVAPLSDSGRDVPKLDVSKSIGFSESKDGVVGTVRWGYTQRPMWQVLVLSPGLGSLYWQVGGRESE